MFSYRLKELRKKKGLTQEQLAKVLGVERSSIGKYEGKAGVIPSPGVLQDMAAYFGVTVDHLLGREEPQKRPAVVTDDDLKFALFGDVNVSDEVFEEVRRFAKFAKEQRENKND